MPIVVVFIRSPLAICGDFIRHFRALRRFGPGRPSHQSDLCRTKGIMRTCQPEPDREMNRFSPVDRQTGYPLPPSVDDCLPEDHRARFIVEVVDRLDASALERAYAGRGSAAYHPSVLLSLLVYGCATGGARAARLNGRRMTRWRFVLSLQVVILTMTRWRRFAGAFSTTCPAQVRQAARWMCASAVF